MKSKQNALFCLLTAACVAAVFISTIFQDKPISRLALISQLDVFCNSKLSGAEITVAQDPSACLQSIPKETFIQNSLARGESPIWNPNSGCGQPLIADPSNTLWSPFDLFFPPTNLNNYNIGLVVKLIFGSIVSYFFFLRNGARPWAACTAATGFVLSARVLKGLELATNFELIPGIFLVFQILKPNATWKQVWLSAIALAICYAAMHPEVYFIAVLTAVALWLMEFRRSPEPSPKGTRFSQLYTIGKLAITTVAFVAPLLFPFLEYLHYAHSYKYNDTSLEHLTLFQLPFFLAIPKIAGTLFPGWLVLLGLPAGIATCWKERKMLFPVTAFLILFATRPGPLEGMLGKTPYSYLLPEYALGPILLFVCLIAAVGLSRLNELNNKPIAFRIAAAILSVGLVLSPLLLSINGQGVPLIVNTKIVWAALVLLASSAAFILIIPLSEKIQIEPSSDNKVEGNHFRIRTLLVSALMLAFPILNLSTLAGSIKAELPIRENPQLPPTERLEFLKKLQAATRFTACGTGLMPPNTGLLYGLSDLRTCSPLNNIRYLNYMKQLGAKLGYCNMIEVPPVLTPLLDLASVDLVLSATPIRSYNSAVSTVATAKPSISPVQTGRIMPGMRLIKTDCKYFPSAGEIEARVTLRVHENLANRYQIQLLLKDQTGNLKWRSSGKGLSPPAADQMSAHDLNCDMLIPVPTKENGQFDLLMVVNDGWTGKPIMPDGSKLNCKNEAVVLASYSVKSSSPTTSLDGRFELVDETQDLLRIYKNKNALPRAYLVHNVTKVNSEDEALQRISSAKFEAPAEAVVETGTELPESIGKGTGASKDEVQLIICKNTELVLIVNSESPSLLVLTDLFYPGWQAEVDAHPTVIHKCNYLFRGIILPEGKHTVTFQYRSSWLNLAMFLFLFAATASILSWISNFLPIARFYSGTRWFSNQ